MPKPQSDLANTEVTPEPALEKRTRRQFTAEYKLRIIKEADACRSGGAERQVHQIGAITP